MWAGGEDVLGRELSGMRKARQQVGEEGDSILSSDLRVGGRRKVA